jgi:hypothetical protein
VCEGFLGQGIGSISPSLKYLSGAERGNTCICQALYLQHGSESSWIWSLSGDEDRRNTNRVSGCLLEERVERTSFFTMAFSGKYNETHLI